MSEVSIFNIGFLTFRPFAFVTKGLQRDKEAL